MNIYKIAIFAAFACILSATSMAQTRYVLPKQHQQLADSYTGCSLPVTAVAMAEARAHSPFAGTPAPLENNDTASPTALKMISYAKGFLGTRYRLGASGPKAFDCSGFTSYVFRNFGIALNRDSRSQFLQGEKVSVGNLRPGDLLFFSSRSSGRGRVGHVAMVVSVDPATNSCKFIHASTKRGVVYQNFPDGGYYQRNFVGARRILGTELDASSQLAAN